MCLAVEEGVGLGVAVAFVAVIAWTNKPVFEPWANQVNKDNLSATQTINLHPSADWVKTPNPEKAPWYFIGPQEILVYYDPWFSGHPFVALAVVTLAFAAVLSIVAAILTAICQLLRKDGRAIAPM